MGLPWRLDVLIQGYPGRTSRHGALGWCSVALLRAGREAVIVDTGSYGYRGLIEERLGGFGLTRSEITAVLVSHLHWDHVCNYPFFPGARVIVPAADLEWAVAQPPGDLYLPELHVERLATESRVERVGEGDEPLPGISVIDVPGHTPGSAAYVAAMADGILIMAGDAVKNQAELASGRADRSMDEAAGRDSIARVRALALASPANRLLCGHDRLLAPAGGRMMPCEPRGAGIRARLGDDFDAETDFDLTS